VRQEADDSEGEFNRIMAKKPSRKYNVGPPASQPLQRKPGQKAYFFIDGILYKLLRQDRANDLMTAWDYSKDVMVHLVLSDAKKRMKAAYDTVEVAQLLNRNRAKIQDYVLKGVINPPIKIHVYGTNATGGQWGTMKWSEDDIIALHDYLLTHGGGRPRKDGTLYAGARLPSRRELLALMRQQPMFYMKTANGEMVPVWSAYNEV
jgi:hypothetical protein